MFKTRATFFLLFFLLWFLTNCENSNPNEQSTSTLEEKIDELQKESEELQRIINSRLDEELKQLMEECEKLRKDPNADPNEVTEVESKIGKINRKMGIFNVMGIECKYKSDTLNNE